MSIETLVRPEILALRPYVAASQPDGAVRLHANEAPFDACGSHLNRYPQIRPLALQHSLARRFGVGDGNVLTTRGSSEAIDLLIRAFCVAGNDNIVTTPPTFGMYRVYADIQGAATLVAPLDEDDDFAIRARPILERCDDDTKLVFVCSPNNPTGSVAENDAVETLLEARRGRSIVVVDEAYIEFSDRPSVAPLLHSHDNLVVLRTTSKALGLAGARCGALLGTEQLVRLLDGVLSPYALSTPVIRHVTEALAGERLAAAEASIASTVSERERIASALASLPAVERVWPSQANFLLARFVDPEATRQALRAARVLIREFPDEPNLEGCARITIGARDENDRLLVALGNGA